MMPAPFADVQNLIGVDNLAESALTLSDQALERFLKQLHLTNARHVWRDLVQRAEREAWSCRDFLALLVTEEMAHRRASRWTHFPFLKTIEEFHFTHQSVVRRSSLDSALAPDFVTSGRSLILSG